MRSEVEATILVPWCAKSSVTSTHALPPFPEICTLLVVVEAASAIAVCHSASTYIDDTVIVPSDSTVICLVKAAVTEVEVVE